MAPQHIEPLITSAPPALLDALAFPISDYGTRFTDLAFWRPYVELIAGAHGLPAGEITMGEPGTFPTFIIGRTHVVKLFGAPFDGLRCRDIELAAAQLVADQKLPLPIPPVIAAGSLARDPAWRYLVTAFVPGEPLASAATTTRRTTAATLGRMLRPLHDLPVPAGTPFGTGWDGWRAFIAGQRRGVAERHRAWGTLPERLIGQIDGYVAGYRVPEAGTPSLVHADLHDQHLIGVAAGDDWTIRGVIDWGDARLGDRCYELPALHIGTFHGNRALLRVFLEACDWPDHRSGAFVRRAMALTLLHEFNVLDQIGTTTRLDAIATLDDLAACLWCV